MKTLQRYVFGSVLSSFLLAFLVLSFVMTIGVLVQIVGYIMKGVPMNLVGEFCLVSLPEMFPWSIPPALLFSVVLVFSRLSTDSELAAMRACGVNLYSVVLWPILLGVFCASLGVFITNEVSARAHMLRRTLKERVSVGAGLSVLEPGHTISEFPNVKMSFERKEGDKLYKFEADILEQGVLRHMTAEEVKVTQQGADIKLELHDMTLCPIDEKHRTMLTAKVYHHTIKDALEATDYDPTPKDMNFCGLLKEIDFRAKEIENAVKNAKDPKAVEAYVQKWKCDTRQAHRDLEKKIVEAREYLCGVRIEFNKRLVLAVASLCFVLIGIPLGISSQRKENSLGIVFALGVLLAYYGFFFLMQSFESMYYLRPEYLSWLPVAACFVLAWWLMRKHL